MMKKIFLNLTLTTAPSTILATFLAIVLATSLATHSFVAMGASFSLGGNYRFGTNMLVNTDLSSGNKPNAGKSTNFLEHRFLLQPNVLIDERFSVNSELSFAQSNAFNTVGSDFGTTLDSSQNNQNGGQLLVVRNLYLNWSSDWGLFRFGRIPKSWGLGVLYDGGLNVFDDHSTITDRAEFLAMLGNLGLRASFEKGSERLAATDADDIDTYELSVDYSDSNGNSNVGILYSRNVRSYSLQGNSSHDLSIFAKRKWNQYELGAEFVSLAEEDRSTNNGFLLQADYQKGAWQLGYDLSFASSTSNSSFAFHPNYRPFMMLFRQSLGPNTPASEIRAGRGVGSDLNNDGGGGAIVNKAHLSYRFDASQLTLGTDLGFARLGRAGATGQKNLGFETDIFVSQQWYDNFKIQYAFGVLFPGKAFTPNPKVGWGFELKGALEF